MTIDPGVIPPKHPPAWRWPVIIVGLLAFQIALSLFGVFLATNSQSFAVEPDYYSKALHWDDLAARQRASEALHWQADLAITDTTGMEAVQGKRLITLTLHNRAGQPLDSAGAKLLCFQHAHARDALTAQFHEIGDGRYTAVLPMRLAGIWEFRIVAEHGQDVFVETVLRELPRIGGQPVARGGGR